MRHSFEEKAAVFYIDIAKWIDSHLIYFISVLLLLSLLSGSRRCVGNPDAQLALLFFSFVTSVLLFIYVGLLPQ